MPEKKRGRNRLSPVIASGCLFMIIGLWAGCDIITPDSKKAPPTPHKLGDITLKGSEAPMTLTATAMVSPESEPANAPVADETGPKETGVAPAPPATKKKPEETAKKPIDTLGGPARSGEFTIQVGAYIIEENLAVAKGKLISLGFSPYTKDTKRKMKMFCVIVGESMTEGPAQEIVSALSAKGFDARLLPNPSGTVDVAGGIYYYRDDASSAQEKIRALGYTARVEERTVEVTVACLRIGAYKTVDEAGKDLAALERKGFSPVILKSDQ